MGVRALVFAAIGVGIAISAGVIAYSLFSAEGPAGPQYGPLGFDYSMNSQLRDSLSEDGISMSSPIRVSKAFDIQKYCTFFDDAERQGQIKYCTSTELLDGDGRFLGNVHMVGTPESPKLVIAILEASLEELDTVSAVFDTVIDETVCECWEAESLPGLLSVHDWVVALKDHHQTAVSEKTTKSSVLTLDGTSLQIEVTTIEGAYVWKLFVAG